MKCPVPENPSEKSRNEFLFQQHGALLLKGAKPSRSSETMVISIQLGPANSLGHFITSTSNMLSSHSIYIRIFNTDDDN